MSDCSITSLQGYSAEIVSIFALTFGIISVIACLYVIFGTSILHGLPVLNKSSSMLFLLTISDLFLALFVILSSFTKDNCSKADQCSFIAFGSQFFSLSSFLWTVAITNSSMISVKKVFQTSAHDLLALSSATGRSSNRNKEIGLSMRFYHFLCWGLPIISLLIMIGTNAFGFIPVGHTCWLTTIHQVNSNSLLPLSVAIILYWIPLLFILFYNIYVFRFLLNTLKTIPFAKPLISRFTR